MKDRIPITAEIRDRLRRYRRETGLGFIRLIASHDDVPDGLTANTVTRILNGSLRTIPVDHLAWLEAAWRNVPPADCRVELSRSIREQLIAWRASTGCGIKRLFEETPGCPDGLSPSAVDNWLDPAVTVGTVLRSHLVFVMNAYQRLDATAVPVAEFVDELRAHKERTRINSRKLLEEAQGIPEGLSAPIIDKWLTGSSGSARKDHMAFVLDLWRRQPDRAGRCSVTPAMIETLVAHHDRTGIGVTKLLRGRKDRPRGLTSSTLQNVIRGDIATIRADYLDYVIRLYEQVDDRVEVTPVIRRALEEEVERTGKSVRAIMLAASDPPSTLSLPRAQKIFCGEVASAFASEIEFLRSAFRRLPNCPPVTRIETEPCRSAGRVGTRNLSMQLAAPLMDCVTRDFERLAFVNRNEYLRHLVRCDRLKPCPAEKIKASIARNGEITGARISMNFGAPSLMLDWLSQRTQQLSCDSEQYIGALIALSQENITS